MANPRNLNDLIVPMGLPKLPDAIFTNILKESEKMINVEKIKPLKIFLRGVFLLKKLCNISINY